MSRQCTFCPETEDLIVGFYPMAGPIEDMEVKIKKYNNIHNPWWELLDSPHDEGLTEEQNKELEGIAFYDQLLNTVGKALCCPKCDEKLWKDFDKYYPINE